MKNENDTEFTINQLMLLEKRMTQLKEQIAAAAKLRADQLLKTKELTIIIFQLRNQSFGIPISDVKEVIQMVMVTPLPNSPPSIAGLINLRGKVIPVINIDKIFGLKETTFSPEMAIIVIEKDDAIAGVIVDSVQGVQTFQRNDIELTTELKQLPQTIAGAIKASDAPVFVIDIKNLFETVDFDSLSKMTALNSLIFEKKDNGE